MSSSIGDYRKMVEQPWGKMFYEQIFRQLSFPEEKRRKILDFGAGFCITSEHYAQAHDVTAVEPSEEMRSLRVESENYTLIPQGIEYLSMIEDHSFDVVFCHNVLEYVQDKEAILAQLVRVLKPGGRLSIIKHNLCGRVMALAVLQDDPKSAGDLLLHEGEENSMFGSRDVYPDDYLNEYFGSKMNLLETYGIRTFFGLSSNNEIKYTEEWYQPMLELETKASTMEEYKKIAFFHHLIFQKN